MNKRIGQLAEQAGLLGPSSRIGDAHEATERFAGLIVRECRDIVSATRDQAIEDEWNVDEAMSTAMFDIEDHFGV